MSDTILSAAIAKAVHNRLSTHLGMQNHLGDPPRLYDSAPEDPVYPYLTYGDVRAEDESADGLRITCHRLTLHIWSRYAGRSETFDILAAVSSALEQSPISVPLADDICVAIPYVDILRAPDGRTLHGLIRVNIRSRRFEAGS